MSMSLTKSQYCDYEQGAVVSSLAHVSGRCAHMCTGGYVRCDAGHVTGCFAGLQNFLDSEVNFIRPALRAKNTGDRQGSPIVT